MDNDDERPYGLGGNGFVAYDLKPSSDRRIRPHWTPFRGPGELSPRPRWAPPPLPDGHVRVELGDDYYEGAHFSDWTGQETGRPAGVFDVPREQYERWVAARDAYAAMQEEVEALISERSRTKVPDGWVRKDKPYQAQP